MKQLCDYHLHTDFSGDCEIPATKMIEQAIALHMPAICITDHLDFDYPNEAPDYFLLPKDAYYEKIRELSEQYASDIEIMTGIETGLEPDKRDQIHAFASAHPYDFIIGSSHLVHRQDPYYPAFFEGRSDKEAFTEYFESILENIAVCDDYDVYGHLDYVVRYSPNKAANYCYAKYQDILDEILRQLIQKGKGIEINTGGYRYGLGVPNPHPDILRRYKELGGELLTIGSDAHTPEYVGNSFHLIRDLLTECGFQYYTIFKNRKPIFMKIN